MNREWVADAFRSLVTGVGLTGVWEKRISPWPRVLLYHLVSDGAPDFLGHAAISQRLFYEHVEVLRKRYRFIDWDEYRALSAKPAEARGTVLLTWDDGFRDSFDVAKALADEKGIPSVIFLNTRVIENAYAPWMIQLYYLMATDHGKFLPSLWKRMNIPEPPSQDQIRALCHDRFSIKGVVLPIEETLAEAGLSPEELARRENLFVSFADLEKSPEGISYGDHSHSHYILSKLSESELRDELAAGKEVFEKRIGRTPGSFAYPFGVTGEHFDKRCLAAVRRETGIQYIFSASPQAARLLPGEINRACLEPFKESQRLERDLRLQVSSVSPSVLLRALGAKGGGAS